MLDALPPQIQMSQNLYIQPRSILPACSVCSGTPKEETFTKHHGRIKNIYDSVVLHWYDCHRAPFFMYVVSEMGNTSLGLFTNIWVLLVILRDWRKQGAQEIFTINLAILEILYCLLSLVLILSFILLKIAFINNSSWFIYGLCFFGRLLFQCGLCVERYVAVVHPVFFFKHHYLKYKVTFLIICWIVTLLLCYLYFVKPDILITCSFFTVVVSVNGFCIVSILRVLRCPSPGTEGKKVEDVNRIKKRASHTVGIVLACLMFNFIPVFIGPAIKSFITSETFVCFYIPFGIFCCLMGSFGQPLLFLHRAGKLKFITQSSESKK